MHPAPSVLVFTVLSGLGFGTLAFLALFAHLYGLPALLLWGLGYGFAIVGLLASTFHLGHPERAWRAFSQWRTSWLSREGIAPLLLTLLALAVMAHWQYGDRRFAEVGASMGSATGLGALGKVSVFDPAHTAGNYLMREMIFVVGRKHAAKLRVIALVLACVIPALILVVSAHPVAIGAAVMIHLIGAFAARWLFFAEAEHVVGLYYGRR